MKYMHILIVIYIVIIYPLDAQSVMHKEYVKMVQIQLLNVGFSPGKVDGIYGTVTKKAISNFQKYYHIRSTGLLDSETIKKLESVNFKNERAACETGWSPQECGVWRDIIDGNRADLEEIVGGLSHNYSENWCDPKRPEKYPDESVLSGKFIYSLLSNSEYKRKIPINGIEIVCARFDDFLDLSDVSFDKPLKIKYSVFKSAISLRNMQSDKDLNFQDSYFEKDIQADYLNVDCNLNLIRINLQNNAKLMLRNAKIGGQLDLKNAYIDGSIIAEKAEIGGDLLLFSPKGDLSIDDRGRFKNIDFAYIKVGSFFQLRGSKYSGIINLSGAHIKGELHIASPKNTPPIWEKGSSIRLRNTRVHALQVMKECWDGKKKRECWPDKIDIVGFVYNIPYGLRSEFSYQDPKNTHFGEQTPDELIEWVRLQDGYGENFYPQPYEQLSMVLRREGRIDAAKKIMYYSKLDEMSSKNTGCIRWFWLFIKKWTIGFGYYPWRSCYFIAGLILIGTFLLRFDDYSKSLPSGEKISYIIDAAIPVIALNDEKHKEMDLKLKRPVIYFCYGLKILAFILFSFLVAGLTGLVK